MSSRYALSYSIMAMHYTLSEAADIGCPPHGRADLHIYAHRWSGVGVFLSASPPTVQHCSLEKAPKDHL